MFRRRKAAAEDDAAPAPEPGNAGEDGPDDREAPVVPTRPQGPWDAADAPDSAVGQRIDLGSLLVPVPPDTEVRVDVGPEGEVLAATLVRGEASMQLSAFAAPRSDGIWGEVAEEIGESLMAGGGKAEQVQGPHGLELHAHVPTEVQGQGVVQVPARFIGVDGPRWFLRALLTGSAAVEEAAAEPLLAALRDVVVVRGGDPMAVRDTLPLRLPRDVGITADDDPEARAGSEYADDDIDDDDGDDGDDIGGRGGRTLTMPERGPEITETR